MFSCAVCGCQQSSVGLVDEVFNVDGEYVLVERIPAEICIRCGEQSVSIETFKAVRMAVKGAAIPARSIQMRVFEFESAEGKREGQNAIHLQQRI